MPVRVTLPPTLLLNVPVLPVKYRLPVPVISTVPVLFQVPLRNVAPVVMLLLPEVVSTPEPPIVPPLQVS